MSRESILTIIENKINVIPGINYVTRKPITKNTDLKELANTQFPAVNVIGGMPLPIGGKAIELGAESFNSSITSELEVFIKVFGRDSETPDTRTSTLLQLVYQNLYYDPNLKGYDYTDKATNVSVDVDTVIFCTEESLADATKFTLKKSKFAYGVTADLLALPYTDPVFFLDVTASLVNNAYSVSVRPSAIVQFEDPHFAFMLVLTVVYKHKTYSI